MTPSSKIFAAVEPFLHVFGVLEISSEQPRVAARETKSMKLHPETLTKCFIWAGIDSSEEPGLYSCLSHLHCDKLGIRLDELQVNNVSFP